MDEVYDLHQHTHYVAFRIRESKIDRQIYCSVPREDVGTIFPTKRNDSYITYDKQKLNVLSWGRKCDNKDKDTVQIDISEKRLHRLFKKGKDSWSEDDLFLFKAVSDYIGLSVKESMEEQNEDINELKIPTHFTMANLISEDDHKDRLLFCTDVECTYYYMIQYKRDAFKLSLVIDAVEESKVSIKLDLILIGNPIFDLSYPLLFPKLLSSKLSFLTANDVKNGIREFIKTKFSFDAQEETIKNVMEEISYCASYEINENLKKPFITDKSVSELDKKHETLIKSIRPIDICAEISKNLPNNLKLLLPNDLGKKYSIFSLTAVDWDRKVDNNLFDWSKCMLDYNRIVLRSNYIIPMCSLDNFDYRDILAGAVRYMFDVLQNSDVYSKPRILPTEHLATSSSIFLKSKPDAILNIDISLESTMLSFSLLDENGLVKKIWDHDYYVHDIPLRSLGSFFSISEETTLNVKNLFIVFFVNEYFTNDPTLFFNGEYDAFDKSVVAEIKCLLNVERQEKDLLVSTQQQLSTITANNANIKIGYAITIESMLLKRLFGTEDDLRDIIYTSNLVRKNDSYKKLRIATHGEVLFPVIQRSFKLQFPVKSFFVVAQLYENYVQLTLNQVVTKSGLDNKYQEAIIVQEEMVPIPNIYKSLCFNMWNSMTENSSLIQLCDTYTGYNDHELLEIFTLKNQAEFTNNLKEFISKNLPKQKTETFTISLNFFSTSFTRNNFLSIQYVFNLIRFNYNPKFQHILMKILQDETDHFLYEERIDIDHYTLPKLSNQLLQPVLQQEPFSYKAFKVGVLYHVYSENYGFGIDIKRGETHFKLKNKMSDSKFTSINDEPVFPLFKKGNRINMTQIKRAQKGGYFKL
ncbi:hypothetical protein MFLAVUS_001812 [Mucor flavus]|uniref:Uncharacterized protein n=1 Tax=Mucor flavus TaxID=439312 RepID=A0ABP9YNJ2_9FUNG